MFEHASKITAYVFSYQIDKEIVCRFYLYSRLPCQESDVSVLQRKFKVVDDSIIAIDEVAGLLKK